MPKTKSPRSGSLQFWPRKRAKKETARVRSWAKLQEAKLLGFAGYKVGMTHIFYTDNRAHSLTKGSDISCPVTVIECPPLKTISVKFYKKTTNALTLSDEILAEKLDKEFARKINLPKKIKKKIDDMSETQGVSEHAQESSISDIKDYDDIRLLVVTQPKLTGIGKKKPELFEIAIGGNKEDKQKYAKEKLGKEIHIHEIFSEGQQIDIHGVTKGKGFQGAVKRFGIGLRSHKSEKTIRGPGSLGPWRGQGHVMWRVAHAGKMGYHLRTEYNKLVLKIGNKKEEINQKGGFIGYGMVKNPYILIKGSTIGPVKRLLRFNLAIRPNKKVPKEAPNISYISLTSKQGN